jgi:hypothetical protein
MSPPAGPPLRRSAQPGEGDRDDRLVCAVLAAQVVALRDCMHANSAVEALWQACDGLADAPATEAMPGLAQVRSGLEDLAFSQAQLADCLTQMADCVVTALDMLARSDARLPAGELLALYVTEAQRRVHEAAVGRFVAAERKKEAVLF